MQADRTSLKRQHPAQAPASSRSSAAKSEPAAAGSFASALPRSLESSCDFSETPTKTTAH